MLEKEEMSKLDSLNRKPIYTVNKRKYFSNLLKVNLIIAICYSIVLVTVFYFCSKYFINIATISSKENMLEQTITAMDDNIKMIFWLKQRIITDTDIVKRMRNNTGKDLYLNISVQKLLSGDVISTNHYIYTSVFSKLTDDIVVSSDFSSDVNDFFNRVGITENVDTIIDYFKKAPNAYKIVKSESADQYKNNFITVILSGYANSQERFYIFVTINMNEFIINGNEENGLIIKNAEQEEIYSYNNQLTQNIKPKNAKNSYYEQRGVGITRGTSAYNNWEYIKIDKDMVVQMNTILILLISLGLCILVLIILGIIMYIISKRMYAPINNVVNKIKSFSHNYQDDETDELSFIQNTVYNIKNGYDILNNRLQDASESIMENFFRSILTCSMTNEYISETAKKFGVEIYDGSMFVAVLELLYFDELERIYSKETLLILNRQLQSFIKESLASVIFLDTIELDYNKIGIVLKCDTFEAVKQRVLLLVNELEAEFGVELQGNIGQPCDGIMNIQKSYISACEVLNRGNLFDLHSSVKTYMDFSDEMDETYFYPFDVERQIYNDILRGNKENVLEILDNLLCENFEKRNLSDKKIFQFLFVIVATVERIIEMLHKKISDFFPDGNIIFLELKMYKNKNDIKEKIRLIFEMLVDTVNEEMGKKGENIVNSLMNYIEGNYNMDISLMDFAKHFNVSGNYMSTLFKEATGQNFKDTLNSFRIEKAKEIIENNPYIKIKELPAMLGFNTDVSFFRTFKKYTGLSPGQYIQNVLQDNNGNQ